MYATSMESSSNSAPLSVAGSPVQASAYAPAKLQAKLLAADSPGLELSFRPMFGRIMGYAGGRSFASLSNVGLAFKLAGTGLCALVLAAGLHRAVPVTNTVGPPSADLPCDVLIVRDPDRLGRLAGGLIQLMADQEPSVPAICCELGGVPASTLHHDLHADGTLRAPGARLLGTAPIGEPQRDGMAAPGA